MAEQSAEKGVIDIVSSKFKLGRLTHDEDRIEIAPALVAIPEPLQGISISSRCGAVHLIRHVGKPRPELRVSSGIFLTPFLYPNINAPTEEKGAPNKI